ncbi:MAG TPA: glycosyltransferase, partial [Polyangiaceae bacterium]|nr:glycosyltransferase [Polyangiaceae bacterium]
EGLRDVVAWYCSPAALTFSAALRPVATVYDCAGHEPPAPAERERDLLRRADLVFTDGVTPFATARPPRARVYAFPNAVEVEHFGRARAPQADPDDQIPLPGPRLGLVGPVDRRLDLALLDAVARARPGWQLVAVGPVARDLRAELPRRPNLHFLGPKSYAELPRYLAGWHAALIPLVRGGMAPRACPSKALEYLAAGRPVVATSCLGELPREARGLVRFADDVDAFVAACEQALADAGRPAWFARADAALAHTSWDRSFRAIDLFVDAAVVRRLGLAEGGPRSTAPSAPHAPLDAIAPDEANAASAAE